MGNVVRAYAPSRYGQLHYQIVTPDVPSSAPPLLCLHQTPSNSREWLPVLPILGERRVVIAVDTPGYGMSDAPPEPVRIEDFAEVMSAFMDELALQGVVASGPFDVMGFHTGSIIATQMAATHPEGVRRVVVFGLAAYGADARAAKLENLRNNFPTPGPDLGHVEKLWAIVGQLSDPRVSAEDRHIGMAECLRLGSRMPWGYIAVYLFDFLDAMTRVEQPVLIVNAQDDLWDVTREAAHNFRHGERWDLPGVAHGVLTLERDRVVARIEQFLQTA